MALAEKKADRTKAKAAWTKQITQATGLLSKAGQSDKVETLRDNIVQLHEQLLEAHEQYVAEVSDTQEKSQASVYEADVNSKQSDILTSIAKYIAKEESRTQSKLPTQGACRTPPASVHSSRTSQKQAELLLRAKALKEKQRIEMQQLQLQQEAIRVDLQLELDLEMAGSEDGGLSIAGGEHRVEDWLHKYNPDDAPMDASGVVLQNMLENLHIPRAEMISFEGNPMKYRMFIQAFDDNVGHKQIDDAAKLTRLLQFCKGKARTVIEPCALMTNGYTRARELLRERFGREHVIAQAWLERVCYGGRVREENVREFADELTVFNETLKCTNSLQEVNQQNLRGIVERLPTYIQHQWRKEVLKVRNRKQVPILSHLVELVSRNAEILEDPVYGSLGRKRSPSNAKSFATVTDSPSFTAVTDSARSRRTLSCILCSADHTLFRCEEFQKMDPRDRYNLAKNNRLCYNCLNKGHSTKECRLERSCNAPNCKLKHTKFLHFSNSSGSARSGNGQSQVVAMQSSATGNSKMVLPVARVRAYREDGSYVTTNALVDSGSTNSFCSQRLLDELKLSSYSHEVSFVTLEGSRTESVRLVPQLNISNPISGKVLNLYDVCSKVSLNIGKHNMIAEEDVMRWSHLDGVPIPSFDEIDMLIGQDCPAALIPLQVRKHRSVANAPYAVETELGWLISGPTQQSANNLAACNYLSNEALQTQIEKFWKVDDVTFDDRKCPSMEDKKAEILFDESVKLTKCGHYEIAIPFKCANVVLENNKSMALGRLNSLKGKLKKDESLHSEYTDQISSLVSKQYAEKVPADVLDRSDGKVWYLPHHPVMHPRKKKMRLVFDCAAKYNDVSLNDKVMQGPDYTNSLVGVLLRFRNHPVAVMSDIEGMFHQAKVPIDERDVLRFLWWQDGDMNKSIIEYRMTSHLFGGTWSPSVSNYALRKTAKDNEDLFSSKVISVVNDNFYVDDCMFSVESVDEAVEMSCDLRELLSKGGFRLHKFSSNNVSVLKNIPESERAENMRNLNFKELPVETALGVYWNLQTDQFEYKVNPKEKPLTRRGVLSMMCSIYDPIGFVCPLTIVLKIMNQDLTRSKYSWDEPLDETFARQWLEWMSELRKMEKFTVPRCIKPAGFGPVVRCELHHFSDASEVAYGAASYVRLINESGNVSSSLLMAKSRVSPIKQMSIPRLELSAATVSVRLDIMLRRELSIEIDESVFWSDSQIVIAYINNESRRFNTFVANRLALIHSASTASQWKYVKSEDNPGDDISRGKTAEELVNNQRWLKGPEFLQNREYDATESVIEVPCDDVEVKASKKTVQALTCEVVDDPLQGLIERCSTWNILLRRVAILRKFWKFFRTRAVETRLITVKELEEARSKVISYVQMQHYGDELVQVQSGKCVKKGSTIYQLEPLLAKTGELCTGGRTGQHQVILPKSHHVVKLLVQHYHEAGHCGREYVVARLREQYWVVGVRSIVRSVLKQCYKCKFNYQPASSQRMSDLGKERIQPDEAPFTHVGIDYFGPYLVKRARSTVKRYGCVFVCLNSKAIHIEVAHSLDTDSCINAIERFISRRGKPKVIFSDNGTNLVSAEKEMRESLGDLDQDKLERQFSEMSIQWKFNPPSASHMGGIWERQIRSIRKVLAGVIKEQPLDDEKLSTLMCIVESILNSRPLTSVSSDINDLEALTPNHILLLRPNAAMPRGVFDDRDNYTRRRWRQVQYLADVFWKRWIREYLPSLQLRSKWIEQSSNMTVGDLVLVVDNNVARNQWNLGRIAELLPGKDGHVRVVKVKTKSGVYLRPIHKLCLLESANI